MTTTLTCPRCDLSFETEAVTNTRCRQCRTVVRVPRSVDSTAGAPSPSKIRTLVPTPVPETMTVADLYPDGPPLVLVVALGAVLVVAIAVAIGRRVHRPSTGQARSRVRVAVAVSEPRTEEPAGPSPSPSPLAA